MVRARLWLLLTLAPALVEGVSSDATQKARQTLVRSDKVEDDLDDQIEAGALAGELGEEGEESTELHQEQLEQAGEMQAAEVANEARGAALTDEGSDVEADELAEPMPDDDDQAAARTGENMQQDVDDLDGLGESAAFLDEGMRVESELQAEVEPGDVNGRLVDAWQARALLAAASKVVDSKATMAINSIHADAAAAFPHDDAARQHRVGTSLNSFSQDLLGSSWTSLGIDKDQIVPTILDIKSMSERDPALRTEAMQLLDGVAAM
mmetsp:Transcript_19699/g.35657  ORF Transcript_19699/g.35657 Transcript_19699/m.35657 type:complete len:266 (+) Transcript_19699:55-852(+)